jgi:hypothetical protein
MRLKRPRTIPINRYPFTPGTYPGIRPKFSFFLSSEGIIRLTPSKLDRFLAARNVPPSNSRYAILAYGSNACPGQLVAKKLRDVPVLYGRLVGATAVYTARRAKRGYVPATLARMQGSRSSWITLLTPDQLRTMDTTEGRPTFYSLVELHAIHFCIGSREVSPLYSYVDTRGGVMTIGGKIVALRSATQKSAKAMLSKAVRNESAKWLDYAIIPELNLPPAFSHIH